MAILLKTASVRVSSIQIMQIRVQNKGKSVWKSRYVGDVSVLRQEAEGLRKSLEHSDAYFLVQQQEQTEFVKVFLYHFQFVN